MSLRGMRNNVVAGLFVVVALGLGVWGSFQLRQLPPMSGLTRFTIRFSLEDGAAGLKPGSAVLLAGQEIGRVRSLEFARKDGLPVGVDVAVETRADVTIYENAGIYLELPLLGTLSSINITNVGAGGGTKFTGASAAIEDGDVVTGHIAPPAFLAQAGFGSEQAAELRAALSSLESALSRASKLIDTAAPSVEAGLADAQKLIAEVRGKMEGWTATIDRTAANIEKASGRLDPILAKADTFLDKANANIDQVQQVVAENRAKLGEILDNIRSATGKIDQQTVDQVNAAIAQGRDALGTFSEALKNVSTLVKEETPSLHRTMANLRLMSDQLKLTAVEVRSQPWRLLHQPTTKEMSSQVLYDATRSYAEAASDLRGAAEALKAVGNQEDAAAMSEQLTAAVKKYRAAEKALMDKLIENDQK